MGVIDPVANNLAASYGIDHHGAGPPDGRRGETGRSCADAAYTAEHGVSWAAALIKLLRPNGARVLDVGCADGHLLAKLGSRYAKFGLEANGATGRVAAERGVVVLGPDVVDPALIEEHRGSFDVITAIAAFEHRNIKSGMAAALSLLRDDGVLLFELPFMSKAHDLERVWYPTEAELQRLVQIELGAELVGTELFVTGYASTYVGLVFREAANRQALHELAARVLMRVFESTSAEEAVARMLVHLVHAGTPTLEDIGVLADLPPTMLNPSLLRRLADLWQSDLLRLGQAQVEIGEAQSRIRQLEADVDTEQSDRVRSLTEITASLSVTQAQVAVSRSDLAASIAVEAVLRGRIASLEQSHAAVDAKLTALRAAQASALWPVVAMLSEAAQRRPKAARLARRVARVLWWTLQGRLISGLRLRRQIRRQLRAKADAQTHLLAPLPRNQAQRGEPSPPQPSAAAKGGLSVLDETLRAGQKRAANWPLVSVVVTSFNYGEFLANAVDSVLAQTFKDLEVIVVEGGSTDVASRFVAAGLQRPRTRVLMQGPSNRAGANRNLGISQARGLYICCLDADDTLAPTYIEKALFLLERHGYDVVSSALTMVGAHRGQLNILEQPKLDDILDGNHVLTSAVFRRSHWEQVGGYRDIDRTSGHVHEDWAFWVRLAALGARFHNLGRDPLLRYRVHAASLSRGKDVLPIAQQREMVRQMNRDVLEPIDERVALSKRRASIRYGTPSAPAATIILDRSSNAQSPTVLLAMPFLRLGGAERLLSAVIGHLVQIGWRIVIVTTIEAGAEHGDTTPLFEAHTREIFHLPRCLPLELWEDFIHHIVRSRGVDIAWVAGSAFLYDCLRGLKASYPRLRVADILFNTVGHTANNRRRRDLIDLIFVESNDVHNWLLAHGEKETHVRLVESGVDLATFRPMARSEVLVRQIGAAPDDLIVGFSGRWSEEKNPLGFVEIARLVDHRVPIRFVMTGTGHQRRAIEQAIREAHFPDGRFHLLGEVPEIAPVLASFNLLVIPSVLDGRPVVALEALSVGVPVLASRVGALPDLIQDGRTGWLCEPNDSKAFAGRIERAARDRTALDDMRHRARAYAEARLDMPRMLAAYRSGLASLLSKDRRGG